MYFTIARKGLNDWWRYLAGLLLVFFGYLLLGGLPFFALMAIQTARGVPVDIDGFNDSLDPGHLGLDQNSGLIVMLWPSVVAFFILWGVIVILHRKKTGEIASAEGRIRWSRMFYGAFWWLLLTTIAEGILAYTNPDNYTFHYSAREFLPLLVIALLFIPFQAWFEELLFRGYLMQGTGLLFNSRLAALVLTSVGFGLLHFTNPEVKQFGFYAVMPYYVGFGLLAGILVVMDNGIELAMGVHAVNNVYSAVLVTYESSALKTPALWNITRLDPWALNLALLISGSLFILIMSRTYGWNNWKKIFQPVR